jgi:hypothetical protein
MCACVRVLCVLCAVRCVLRVFVWLYGVRAIDIDNLFRKQR